MAEPGATADHRRSMPPAALIRADAAQGIGTGHVMRCLALAQGLHDAGRPPSFATAAPLGPLEPRIRREAASITRIDAEIGTAEDAEATVRMARGAGAEWVVVDGYRFDATYQRIVKRSGLRLMVIDDFGHASRYHADIVLNQNVSAREEMYRNREADPDLLLGTRYALLRREFRRWIGWEREHPVRARKLLVSFGGSDPENVSGWALRALAGITGEGLRIELLIGGLNPHQAELEAVARAAAGSIAIVRDATDMPLHLRQADMLVSSGGSTCWEAAFFGLPTVVLVLAENQRLVAEELAARGVVESLGDHRRASAEDLASRVAALAGDRARRERMGAEGTKLVDGEGVGRVIGAMACR